MQELEIIIDKYKSKQHVPYPYKVAYNEVITDLESCLKSFNNYNSNSNNSSTNKSCTTCYYIDKGRFEICEFVEPLERQCTTFDRDYFYCYKYRTKDQL